MSDTTPTARFDALREEAFEANLEIPRLGLAILTWGNASAYDAHAAAFAIKPSGVEYSDLKPRDMVVVDLEGRVIEGRLRPSSDTKTHLVLYASFAGIGGICHSHSPNAVAWAQAQRSIPCLGTTHADLLAGEIPCTALLTEEEVAQDYERATGELIVRSLAGADWLAVTAILVACHGPFTWAKTALSAVRIAASLEEVARMAILTKTIDEDAAPLSPHILRKHWERKHGAGSYYGQSHG
jgi:L-ribulose-5-phosphate 4-epimerase